MEQHSDYEVGNKRGDVDTVTLFTGSLDHLVLMQPQPRT